MAVDKNQYNNSITARGSFAMVPNELWERDDLDHTAKVIWCYILSRDPKWDSSRNNVARNLGMDGKTVTKYLKQLVQVNLLQVRKGANNSWDFEIIPPAQWGPTDLTGGVTTTPVSSNPGVPATPLVGLDLPSGEVATTPHPRRKEDKKDGGDDVGGSDQEEKISHPNSNKPSPDDIILAWRSQWGERDSSFLAAAVASQNLADLVATFQNYNYDPSSISIKKVIATCFTNPNHPKIVDWAKSTETRLKKEIAKVTSNVQIAQATTTPSLPPEAKAIYEKLVAEGKKPGDLGGMSLEEYALQRAHASSFKPYDFSKVPDVFDGFDGITDEEEIMRVIQEKIKGGK